jgi:hypothetical protein
MRLGRNTTGRHNRVHPTFFLSGRLSGSTILGCGSGREHVRCGELTQVERPQSAQLQRQGEGGGDEGY